MIEYFKGLLERVNIIKIVVSVVSVSLLAFMCYALVYIAVPEGNKEALYILIGSLSTNAGIIISYYFGSSDSSKKKTELIDKITNK